jgi:hypothetical protein
MILFTGTYDWAHIGAAAAIALREYGQAARSSAKHPVGFYGQDLRHDYDTTILDWVNEIPSPEWIILTDDDRRWFRQLCEAFPRAKRARFWSGSSQRHEPSGAMDMDKELGIRARFVACDLLRLVTDDVPTFPLWTPHLMIADSLQSPIVPLLHAPPNGGKEIPQMPLEYRTPAHLPWRQLQGLLRSTETLFDHFNADLGGFGSLAVEAMGHGCAVFSDQGQLPHDAPWQPPIVHASSLDHAMEMLKDATPEGLWEVRQRSLDWAEDFAAPRAWSRRFLEALEVAARV